MEPRNACQFRRSGVFLCSGKEVPDFDWNTTGDRTGLIGLGTERFGGIGYPNGRNRTVRTRENREYHSRTMSDYEDIGILQSYYVEPSHTISDYKDIGIPWSYYVELLGTLRTRVIPYRTVITFENHGRTTSNC